MKHLLIILVCLLSFTMVSNAQIGTVGWSQGFAADTLGNTILKTSNWVSVPSRACSVTVVVLATGELDTDELIFKRGFGSSISGVSGAMAVVAGDTTTLTINVADGVKASERSTAYDVKGVTRVQATVLGASSGNDTGDPNALEIWFHFHNDDG